jgi:transcriptional regulator with XRE-family HTH domain
VPRLATIYDWRSLILMLRSEHFLGLTHQALAHRLGCSVSIISKWESAGITPQPKFRKKIHNLAIKAGYYEKAWPLKDVQTPRAVPAVEQ